MWTIFKVFFEFVRVGLLLFMSWFLGSKTYGILLPDQGLNLYTLNWKVKS